jgi:hypothetical protein
LQIDLSAIASAAGTATKAYSVAVYVVGVVTGTEDKLAAVAYNAPYDALVHVDNTVTGRNTATVALSETKYVPSIVGVGEQQAGKTTGLKIGLRVFVDGGLTEVAPTTGVGTGYYAYTAYTSAASGATGPFYYFDQTKANDPASYTQLSETEVLQVLNGQVPANCWYTRTETTTTVEGGKEVTTYTYTPAAAGDVVLDENGAPIAYYVRNYAEAITADTTSGNYFTRAEATTSVYQHYVSGAAPSTGSILALEFKTTITE